MKASVVGDSAFGGRLCREARTAHYEPATGAVLEKSGLSTPVRVVDFIPWYLKYLRDPTAGEQLHFPSFPRGR